MVQENAKRIRLEVVAVLPGMVGHVTSDARLIHTERAFRNSTNQFPRTFFLSSAQSEYGRQPAQGLANEWHALFPRARLRVTC
jgi:hypothetical protein